MRYGTYFVITMILVTIVVSGTGCRSTTELTDQQQTQLWMLDSIPDGDVKIDLENSSFHFEGREARVSREGERTSITVTPKWNPDGIYVTSWSFGDIRKIWYDFDIDISLRDGSVVSLESGEWCVEYRDGIAVGFMEVAFVDDFKQGRKYYRETRFAKEDIVKTVVIKSLDAGFFSFLYSTSIGLGGGIVLSAGHLVKAGPYSVVLGFFGGVLVGAIIWIGTE